MRRVLAVGLAAGLMSLTGCAGFFVCQKASCPASSSTSSTVTNYAYVSNSATASTYINGYSLAGGNLTTATTGSPYSLGYTPIAMAVNPADTFLYVAVDSALSSGSVGMYVYSIGTGGQLSIANSGSAVGAGSYTAIDISPDGQWLFALDTTGLILYEYQINSSTGVLTLGNTISITPGNTNAVTPVAVKVAPSADFVVATLGTAGDVIYSFNTSTGLLGATISTISTGSTAVGDYAVAIDSSNNLYLARTTGVAVYTATSLGVPTLVNTYTSGNGPHSIAVSSGSAYAGNQTDGTISAYTVASGPALTALATTSAPAAVRSLAVDKSGTYLLANGYGTSLGLELYTIGSTGALTAASNAGTGTTTTVPAVMALTH
jgi:6-phosphogluconolactonase (cycloisomerase 2 family)